MDDGWIERERRRTVSRILGVFPWYLVVFLSCCSGIFGVLEGNKSGLSLLLIVCLFYCFLGYLILWKKKIKVVNALMVRKSTDHFGNDLVIH